MKPEIKRLRGKGVISRDSATRIILDRKQLGYGKRKVNLGDD